MKHFVESLYFHLTILALSIFALISEDIKYLFLDKSVDSGFVLFNEVVFCVFLVELILNSLCENKFIGSFYFYLDLIALLSVMTDIEFIWGNISAAIHNDDQADMISKNPHLVSVNVASNTSSAYIVILIA
jgi:hypothetical protein